MVDFTYHSVLATGSVELSLTDKTTSSGRGLTSGNTNTKNHFAHGKHMKNCASLADFARNPVLHNLQHWLDKEQLTGYGSPIKRRVLGEKRARSVVCAKESCDSRDVVFYTCDY